MRECSHCHSSWEKAALGTENWEESHRSQGWGVFLLFQTWISSSEDKLKGFPVAGITTWSSTCYLETDWTPPVPWSWIWVCWALREAIIEISTSFPCAKLSNKSYPKLQLNLSCAMGSQGSDLEWSGKGEISNLQCTGSRTRERVAGSTFLNTHELSLSGPLKNTWTYLMGVNFLSARRRLKVIIKWALSVN